MNTTIKNNLFIVQVAALLACNPSTEDHASTFTLSSSSTSYDTAYIDSTTNFDTSTSVSDFTSSTSASSSSSSQTSSSSSSDPNTSIADTSKPVCGDGKIDDGEECDNGDLNGDGSYNGCTKYCELGFRCGDGIIQKDFEECDDGTVLEDDLCVECKTQESRIVFVTAQEYSSAFTSVAVADANCTLAAFQAGLPGSKWVAWISSNNDDAQSRINHFDGWFALPTNPPILLFKGWNSLKLGELKNPISSTEYGYLLDDPSDRVWTATTITGYFFNNLDNCNNWTSVSDERTAIVGSPFETNFRWSTMTELSCDQKFHLYCFENK